LRTHLLTRAAVAVAAGAALLAAGVPAAQALEPDPAAPVVVDDTISIYPYGSAFVDVIANDTDPGDPDGSQLGFCRMPSVEDLLFSAAMPEMLVADGSDIFGPSNQLVVASNVARLDEPYVFSYHVCNYSRLTKATLTVTMRKTAPVTVRKVPGRPGILKVVNHNDERVAIMWGAPRSEEPDGQRRVGAHATRTIRVHDKNVRWVALAGTTRNSGIADQGIVRGVKVPDRKPGDKHHDDLFDFGLFTLLFGRVWH